MVVAPEKMPLKETAGVIGSLPRFSRKKRGSPLFPQK